LTLAGGGDSLAALKQPQGLGQGARMPTPPQLRARRQLLHEADRGSRFEEASRSRCESDHAQLGGVDTKDANSMFFESGFVENQANRVR
jgi:hypothetical protein